MSSVLLASRNGKKLAELQRVVDAAGEETGAITAEYGILTLAAVGFAGVLAVVLTSPDVQSLLVDLVSGALQRD